ncbi:uncharacterized protein AB9X84_024402 isoform 1-T4 [Acanthopagrus schlegelii]
MEQVLFLLVTLAGASHAVFTAAETKCNASQNISLCSAALGGSVYIQMMTNASGYQLQCKKQLPTGPIIVFSLKKDKVTIQDQFSDRMQFFINNGTLKFTNVAKNDSGQYSLEVYDPNGLRVKDIQIKLDVQENIRPIVIIACCVAVFVLIVVVICCCVCRKKKRNRKSGSSI